MPRRMTLPPFMIQSGFILLLIVFSCALGFAAEPPMSLDDYLKRVSLSHPENTADAQIIARLNSTVGRSGQLSDPQVTFSRDRVPLVSHLQSTAQSPMDLASQPVEPGPSWSLSISQPLPWPGTLGAEENAAHAALSLAQTQNLVGRTERRFAATELFYAMIRTAKVIAVRHVTLAEAVNVQEFAHTRFKHGIGSHSESVQTQGETALLAANIANLETDLINLKDHALLLAGMPPTDLPVQSLFILEWPVKLEVEAAVSEASQDDRHDRLRDEIVQTRDADVARAEAAYRRSLPALVASGMVMQEDAGMRMTGAALGISLPVFSGSKRTSLREDASVAAAFADAELSWHDQRKQLGLRQNQRRTSQILANLKVLRTQVIPPMKEHLAAATTDYSQGRGSLSSIIEIRRTLLELQQGEILATQQLALAKLARARILAGFIDTELDQPVPELTGSPAGAMTNSPESTGSMGGMANSPASNAGKRNDKARTIRPQEGPVAPVDEPAAGSSAMGM